MMEEATLISFPGGELCLGAEALGHLMPMFLWVSEGGTIRAAGPTLQKVTGMALAGRAFADVFRLRHPRGMGPADLARLQGQRVQIDLLHSGSRGLRGMAVPVAGGGQGALLNLSFGIAVAEAVREHDLTDRDFAPTDLTVEMLYLIEAKAAVAKENQALTLRLQGARDQAEAEALTDMLTGLGNRRAMERCLAGLEGEGRAFTVFHMDLDHFKAVNDTLGHAAGDHVLRELAGRLRAQIRDRDMLARIGGDEFVLILPEVVQPHRLSLLAQRLLATAGRPMLYEGQPCRISLSIGAAISTQFPEPSDLLAEADRALYSSKHAGRARFTLAVPAEGRKDEASEVSGGRRLGESTHAPPAPADPGAGHFS